MTRQREGILAVALVKVEVLTDTRARGRVTVLQPSVKELSQTDEDRRLVVECSIRL